MKMAMLLVFSHGLFCATGTLLASGYIVAGIVTSICGILLLLEWRKIQR